MKINFTSFDFRVVTKMASMLLVMVLVGLAPKAIMAQTMITVSDDTVCAGGTVTIIATGSDEYAWSSTNGSVDTIAGASVVGTTSNSDSTTLFQVIGTDTATMISDTIDITIWNYVPLIDFMANSDAVNNAVCIDNTTANLTVSGGDASYVYTWQPTATLDTNMGTAVVAVPTSNTTYQVTGVDTFGCSKTRNVTVNINTIYPLLTGSVAPNMICEGETVTLSASGASEYTWSPAATIVNPNASSTSATPTTTTTYKAIGSTLGCKDTLEVTVQVTPQPSMSLTQSSGGAAICLDEVDVLSVIGGGFVQFVWQFPNSQVTTSDSTLTVSPNETSSILVTGTDTSGCTNQTSITVNVDTTCGTLTPIGIDEHISLEKGMNAYVNGANGEIVLQMNNVLAGKYEVRLFNIIGNLMYSNKVSKGTEDATYRLPFNQPSGIYILNVSSDTESLSRRLVK